MPFLTIQPSVGKRFQMAFDKEIIRVGRSSRNEIRLSSDPSLSRFHAEFSCSGDDYFVRDAGSRNGTVLNGQPVTKPTLLRPGDRVSLGETVIFFTPEKESEVEITDDGARQSATRNTVMMPLGEIINSPGAVASEGRGATTGDLGSPQGRAFAILSRAANEMLSHRSLDETLEIIMDMVFEALSPDRGVVMLLEGEPPALKSHAVREVRSREGGQIQLSRGITDAAVTQKQAIMIIDAQQDERFSSRESIQIQGIHSALCVPLWNNRDVIGLIYVDSLGAPGKFTKDDLRLLTLLANLAAVKIENLRLFIQEQKMKLMERELEAAAQIQRRLLPTVMPELPGYEVTGFNEPCREVGGDYFDFIHKKDGRLGIAIGDVSGKGMGAALLMATLQASFRAHAPMGMSITDLVGRLNEIVASASMSNKFISFVYGELEGASGRFEYANAGHNPPLLMRTNGEVEHLPSGGMILGVLPEATYAAREVTLEPGDFLVLYSDGITESQDVDSEEFDEERLIAAMSEHRTESAKAIRESIEEAVDAFVGEAPQFDDVTLVVIKRA